MNPVDTIDFNGHPFTEWDSIENLLPQEPSMVLDGLMDSIFSQHETIDTLVRTSIFSGHSMPPADGTLHPIASAAAPVWAFGLVLLIAIIATIFLRNRQIDLKQLLMSLVDARAMDRMLRSANLTRSTQMIPLSLMLTGSVAIATLPFLSHPFHALWGALLWLVLTAAYLIRNLLIRLLGEVLDSTNGVNLYITSNYLYHITLTLFSLPFLLLELYLPWDNRAIYIAHIVLVALFFIMRIIRGMQLFLTHADNSRFYLFYYLCTVESIPILVLIKLFTI